MLQRAWVGAGEAIGVDPTLWVVVTTLHMCMYLLSLLRAIQSMFLIIPPLVRLCFRTKSGSRQTWRMNFLPMRPPQPNRLLDLLCPSLMIPIRRQTGVRTVPLKHRRRTALLRHYLHPPPIPGRRLPLCPRATILTITITITVTKTRSVLEKRIHSHPPSLPRSCHLLLLPLLLPPLRSLAHPPQCVPMVRCEKNFGSENQVRAFGTPE